ncbi:SGNH/GDSL hydrolase family protein [Streptococcus saliviloxodontae]|uniref:Lysophospholipase L1-like esterase n=1 Tax=Streptococcus saliviloxodontae TaxID=1349416 RepID=A0ABS2PLI7_9STRE|nr:SGNH/GDSL hydrolase family protein [Streptococcus saliviloxodontae]MBM7636308.1 lysophospholipase L1-like esterase [Streptococcus saliviloxodontae]
MNELNKVTPEATNNPSKEVETGSEQLHHYQLERLASFGEERVYNNPIIFAGDSIIEFFPLKKFLGRDYPLVNRGIAGTDSIWLLNHLEEQVLKFSPIKLVIAIGVNDLGRGYPIADIINRLAELVGQIKIFLPQTTLYVQSVLPVNESPAYADKVKVRRNTAIQELNTRLALLSGIEFIDGYDLLLDETGQLAEPYTTDGLHLTQEGYARLAPAFKAVLEE